MANYRHVQADLKFLGRLSTERQPVEFDGKLYFNGRNHEGGSKL